MEPAEHIEWFRDNIDWYASLDVADLDVPVPACPGWTVADVLNHLWLGLGIGYPHALSKAPDTAADQAFVDMDRPGPVETGPDLLERFRTQMNACAEVFEGDDPDRRCFTYAGPGHAAMWFRRAAIETSVHRFDVERAVGRIGAGQFDDRRFADGVAEAAQVVLPLAAAMVEAPSRGVELHVGNQAFLVGDHAAATVSGSPRAMLQAVWGRELDGVDIEGDDDVALEWLTLVGRAFAGR